MLTHDKVLSARQALAGEDPSWARLFAALSDKTRLKIFCLLLQEGELCVSDISNVLNISMSLASQHLRILELSGFVNCERMGQMICYMPRVEDSRVRAIVKILKTS